MEMTMSKIRNLKRRKNEEGFTLVEVMVVMVIIGLMTAFVVVNVAPNLSDAKIKKAKGDIRTLEQAVELYHLDMLDYPEEEFGLKALRAAPPSLSDQSRYRQGGYIKLLPKDPWERDYLYRYPGEFGVYDIFSYGKDGEPGGEGEDADIVSWE